MPSLLALLGWNFICTFPSSPPTLAVSIKKFLLGHSSLPTLHFHCLWPHLHGAMKLRDQCHFNLCRQDLAPKVLNRVVSMNEQASQKYANIHSTNYLGSALLMQALCQIQWYRWVTRSSGPMGAPWVTGNDVTWSWLQRVWSVKGQTANEKPNDYKSRALILLLTFPSLPLVSSTFITVTHHKEHRSIL